VKKVRIGAALAGALLALAGSTTTAAANPESAKPPTLVHVSGRAIVVSPVLNKMKGGLLGDWHTLHYGRQGAVR
jgi:hypothetical protein